MVHTQIADQMNTCSDQRTIVSISTKQKAIEWNSDETKNNQQK